MSFVQKRTRSNGLSTCSGRTDATAALTRFQRTGYVLNRVTSPRWGSKPSSMTIGRVEAGHTSAPYKPAQDVAGQNDSRARDGPVDSLAARCRY